MSQEENFYNQNIPETILRMRDLEEKQRILKDRLILIGKNLIETKEDYNKKFLDIKKELEKMKINMDKLVSFMEYFSEEITKFAKKDDVEILAKQAKMFQPFGNLK